MKLTSSTLSILRISESECLFCLPRLGLCRRLVRLRWFPGPSFGPCPGITGTLGHDRGWKLSCKIFNSSLWTNGKLAASQYMWLGRTDNKWAKARRNDASWCFANVVLKAGCTTRKNIIGSRCSAIEEENPRALEIRDEQYLQPTDHV